MRQASMTASRNILQGRDIINEEGTKDGGKSNIWVILIGHSITVGNTNCGGGGSIYTV